MDTIKNILKYIPGFRTFTLWKMIIAGLYYVMAVFMISEGVGVFLAALSLPFVIFGIVDIVKNKKRGLPAKNGLLSFLIALAVFITGTVLTPPAENSNLRSNKKPNTSITTPGEGINNHSASQTPAQKEKAKVTRVIDGDTFEIEGGKHVRLIGVDTPESVHPDQSKNTEFGEIASAFTKERLEGKTVYLEKDVSETDKYGRLLRYVYLEDNTFYNEYLVKEGIANPATYPPDVKYADLFVKAQQYAKDNNKGLWGLDEQGTENNSPTPAQAAKPTPKPTAKPVSTPTPKPNNTGGQAGGGKVYVDANGRGLIKGNINSKGEKIYHLPGGQYYDRTIPEEWFKTEQEAKAAGYRRSQR